MINIKSKTVKTIPGFITV